MHVAAAAADFLMDLTMDDFQVEGYTATAFTTALCRHKGWTGARADKARRIVEACDEWSRENREWASRDRERTDAMEDCEKFVCRSLGVSVLWVIFTIIRIVVAHYVDWYFRNYSACRSAQR